MKSYGTMTGPIPAEKKYSFLLILIHDRKRVKTVDTSQNKTATVEA